MYTLDANAAREGSQLGAGLIDESGAFTGVIVEAKEFQGNNGAKGIEFSFERDDGAKANFIKIYTTKNDGTPGFGVKQVHALMACLKLRSINPTQRLVKEWVNGSQMDVQRNCFPDLENKRVGLVLQREDYTKDNGDIGFKLNLTAPFNAETRQTAREVLDQSEAEDLNKIVAHLQDKSARQAPRQSPQTQPPSGLGQPSNNDFDDDIPF